MNTTKLRSLSVLALLLAVLAPGTVSGGTSRTAQPRATLVPLGKGIELPVEVDSNSPSYWNVEDDLVLFTSSRRPTFSVGPDVSNLTPVGDVLLDEDRADGLWLESVVRSEDGLLYGYYHFEPQGVCPLSDLTAPVIGSMVSNDDGQSWRDLGIVLSAREAYLNCDTPNSYFAGGVGDFSVILDREKRYLYFLFTTYAGDEGEQGVTVARMPWSERASPVGKLVKFFDGSWSQPGLGGAATAVFPAKPLWEDAETDSYWGPSLHWNTRLEQYVMLLNRAMGSTWANEGVYAAFAPRLDDPSLWSDPQKLLDGGDWYPQVIGLEDARGTDSVAGEEAWFCLRGLCSYRIVFGDSQASAKGLVTTSRAGVLVGAPSAPLPRAPAPSQPRRRRG